MGVAAAVVECKLVLLLLVVVEYVELLDAELILGFTTGRWFIVAAVCCCCWSLV